MERRPGWPAGLLVGALLVSAALAAAPGASATPPAAAQQGAPAYRLAGSPTTGGPSAALAAAIRPGQYVDGIGPGETRWYAARLDAVSTVDLSVTAVPRPGVRVGYGDGLELALVAAGPYGSTCDSEPAHFGQDEGAMTLTDAVSRIPSAAHTLDCDRAGRYLLSVHRVSAPGSDPRRWPIELRYDTEAPLPPGTVPAAARTDYGPALAPVTGTPQDIAGGTGFNDAVRVTTGVWRDGVEAARTRYYKVHVGWGQQLAYTAEFANAPARGQSAPTAYSFVATSAYAPGRLPVEDASDARGKRFYDGSPVSVGLGTVPVTWTNRWVIGAAAKDVHRAGDYWIAVGLGPDAAGLAKGTAVAYVLRVRVSGEELAGPQYHAPALAGRGQGAGLGSGSGSGGSKGTGPSRVQAAPAASAHRGIAPITGTDLLAAGTGGAVAFAGVALTALVYRARNRRRIRTTRGGA